MIQLEFKENAIIDFKLSIRSYLIGEVFDPVLVRVS